MRRRVGIHPRIRLWRRPGLHADRRPVPVIARFATTRRLAGGILCGLVGLDRPIAVGPALRLEAGGGLPRPGHRTGGRGGFGADLRL
ncbi:hypothetical protein G6F40_016597 [Rhizopus arrhizus]|nr:hypothetical protein G6F40_016597 [Rhizopus arrhizus]